ncbi:MAG: hypothetical protein JJE21_04690 [Spirochaetaceae bacterium]|nr:hypothetical protein [Spirochaetaceae bacterium]
MKVKFINIGKVDVAELDNEGLSLVSGNNCSGKTTLVRALYSLLNSYANIESKITAIKVEKIVKLTIKWFDNSILMSNSTHLNEIRREFINSMSITIEGYPNGNIICDKTLIAMVDWSNQLYEYSYEFKINKNNDALFEKMNKALNAPDREYITKIINENLTNNGNINSVLNDEEATISINDEVLTIKNNRVVNNSISISSLKKIEPPIYYNFCSESRVINEECVRKLNKLPIIRNIDTLSETFKVDEIAKGKLLKMIESSINGYIVTYNGELKFKDTEKDKLLSIPYMGSSIFLFAMIARLIENNSLTRGSTLILDAPVANLHSDWYEYLTRILFRMYRDLEINTVLVSTNPTLVKSIENVVNENGDVPTHFYLIREASHRSYSTEVSNDLELIYDELNA